MSLDDDLIWDAQTNICSILGRRNNIMPWPTFGVGDVNEASSTHAAKLNHNTITNITSRLISEHAQWFVHPGNRIERFGAKIYRSRSRSFKR